MKELAVVLLFLTQVNYISRAQHGSGKFEKVIATVNGDLNQDQLKDLVIVSQDTSDDHGPYKLQILFKRPTGEYHLISASTKIIEPAYPDGQDGYATGNRFWQVTIKDGVISVECELLRGYYRHKFRYQNGSFELIGFSSVSSDGHGVSESIDFNLSTGRRLEKIERYDTNKIISNTQRKILIRPLPKLENIVPMEHTFY